METSFPRKTGHVKQISYQQYMTRYAIYIFHKNSKSKFKISKLYNRIIE